MYRTRVSGDEGGLVGTTQDVLLANFILNPAARGANMGRRITVYSIVAVIGKLFSGRYSFCEVRNWGNVYWKILLLSSIHSCRTLVLYKDDNKISLGALWLRRIIYWVCGKG